MLGLKVEGFLEELRSDLGLKRGLRSRPKHSGGNSNQDTSVFPQELRIEVGLLCVCGIFDAETGLVLEQSAAHTD